MQLKHRAVVSNFLFQDEGRTARVALFLRSDKVRTYQGKLAPISGTIEDGERPYDASVREIEEETGLRLEEDFDLYLSGKPYSMKDDSIGRSWTIYPFAWRVKDTAKDFCIDWEHASWQWARPADILNGALDEACVPNLAKSFQRVWLTDGALFDADQKGAKSASSILERALSDLKHDHDSGAGLMASLAVQYFHDVVSTLQPPVSTDHYWQQLRMIAWHIIHNGRPSMNAAIERALLTVLRSISPYREKGKILAQIQDCLLARASMSKKICDSFLDYIKDHFQKRRQNGSPTKPVKISILTLSSSITKSAILTVLRNVPDVEIDLRILESRPLCEGAQMASKLLQNIRRCEEDRLRVTIATDASAAILARKADLVLLGADRIASTGDVSNKTGSFAAALCARAVGNKDSDAMTPKVVILSGTEKIAKPGRLDEHIEEENASLQIWRVWEMAGCKQEAVALMQNNPRVVFKNVFFEWVPAEYIDLYLTEKGKMSTKQIQVESGRVQVLQEEIFGEL